MAGSSDLRILGISAYFHDSAAALIEGERIVAAAQEERFTRVRHDAAFPTRSIEFCLRRAGIGIGDLDFVVFYDKPFTKFDRLLETYVAFAPEGYTSFRRSLPVWIKEKLFLKATLLRELEGFAREKLLFSEHHLSHAASAFYPSPFDEAVVLTLDGVGEWATSSVSLGRGAGLETLREIHFPDSLGLLYSAFTYYTGFKVNSGEYKVMGLAPYGEPRYAQAILDHLLDLREDGSFRLNMEYFDYCTGLRMTNARFDGLFGGPPRDPESKLTQREMDLAASVQAVTEEVLLRMTRSLHREFRIDDLCLAGGVALNCVANGKVLRDGKFKRLWIQPAAGDAGGALGAALAAYHLHARKPRRARAGQGDAMRGSYLGPEFSSAQIEEALSGAGARFHKLSGPDIERETAKLISEGKAVGWFQGALEFGPRALGARSILGDPRDPEMQARLNLKIKFRESFRPFAPAVLRENAPEWFELDADSPYMLLVAPVRGVSPMEPEAKSRHWGMDLLKERQRGSRIPAVTHVDASARVQTVGDAHPRFQGLLREFQKLTGCPVLVNTSFNVRGEPIVCTPLDAFRCFMGTDLDVLAIGDFLLHKHEQPEGLSRRYERAFALD